MNEADISVATMTWARDPREESLLREALHSLAEFGSPVYVTDGGSGEEFVEHLRGLPRFEVFGAEGPGVWAQARRSLRAAASGAEFVLYTEPDKKVFFRDTLREFAWAAPGGGGVGVVLASRSEASFSTFPEFQRYTETAINRFCAEVVGEHLDFTYGPFLLNRELLPYLELAPDEIGWGWRPYAFAVARRLGYRIEPLTYDLPCPAEQREDDRAERLYRMRQLAQSIQGLILSTSVDLTNAPRPASAV